MKNELRFVDGRLTRWSPPTLGELSSQVGLDETSCLWLAERFIGHPSPSIIQPASFPRCMVRGAFIGGSPPNNGQGSLSFNLEYYPLNGGHWPMVSQPERLAKLLIRAARANVKAEQGGAGKDAPRRASPWSFGGTLNNWRKTMAFIGRTEGNCGRDFICVPAPESDVKIGKVKRKMCGLMVHVQVSIGIAKARTQANRRKRFLVMMSHSIVFALPGPETMSAKPSSNFAWIDSTTNGKIVILAATQLNPSGYSSRRTNGYSRARSIRRNRHRGRTSWPGNRLSSEASGSALRPA